MKRLHTYDQYFLRSPRLVLELIGHSSIKKRDLVYDLGAGSGVITTALAKRAGQVVAVENEPNAYAKLRANTQQYDNVETVQASLLDVPLPTVPYKIFANPPFSLSSQLVRRFTATNGGAAALYLIAQKQFARKLELRETSFTGQLGVQLAPWYVVRIRRPLRRTDFTPPPAVDTVFVEIKRRAEPLLPLTERPRYEQFVERCFARQKFFQSLDRSIVSPEKSPSQLSLDEWLRLFVTRTV